MRKERNLCEVIETLVESYHNGAELTWDEVCQLVGRLEKLETKPYRPDPSEERE